MFVDPSSIARRPASPPLRPVAGSETARAVAEVVRVTLLDDLGRQDAREHLARQHLAARLGFAALAVMEASPPPPVPYGLPHPGAAAGTARYRDAAAAAGAPSAVDAAAAPPAEDILAV
ncbi:hypothetical protein [Caenispirillum bisanense]|uniref:hypothetical protein n=1 Tax=Caenispirillum bisanense TaxID=414052 RepID=UPI0031E071A5